MTCKIFVRSYDREKLIQTNTLAFLMGQKDLDLANQLYIVVHENQLERYENALKEYPIAGFVTKSENGGHKSVEAAHKFMDPGEKFIFLDDDMDPIMYHYVDSVKKENKQELDCLGRYIEKAFKTLEEIDGKIWSCSFLSNMYWMQGKPFMEYKPGLVIGCLWGTYNSPEILTPYGHNDDVIRSSVFLEKHGGVLLYNWITNPEEAYKLNEGGMQTSGDRGDGESIKKKTFDVYDNSAIVRKYADPKFSDLRKIWQLKLKSVTKMKSIKQFKRLKWSSWFQESHDNVVDPIQDMFGGK